MQWEDIYFQYGWVAPDGLSLPTYNNDTGYNDLKTLENEQNQGPLLFTFIASCSLILEKAVAPHSSTLENPMDRGAW